MKMLRNVLRVFPLHLEYKKAKTYFLLIQHSRFCAYTIYRKSKPEKLRSETGKLRQCTSAKLINLNIIVRDDKFMYGDYIK